jgi:hypothetical protein
MKIIIKSCGSDYINKNKLRIVKYYRSIGSVLLIDKHQKSIEKIRLYNSDIWSIEKLMSSGNVSFLPSDNILDCCGPLDMQTYKYFAKINVGTDHFVEHAISSGSDHNIIKKLLKKYSIATDRLDIAFSKALKNIMGTNRLPFTKKSDICLRPFNQIKKELFFLI